MVVRNAKIEDIAQAGRIMSLSFRTAFADFVSQETMDACTHRFYEKHGSNGTAQRVGWCIGSAICEMKKTAGVTPAVNI